MTFNNATFSQKTMTIMAAPHKTMKRLYRAAMDLRDVSGQSAVARLLGVSPQVVKNWEGRGISIEGALSAQKVIGCDANWLLDDEVPASDYMNTSWTPAQQAAPAQVTELPSASYKDTSWPFQAVRKDDLDRLSDFDRGQVEGFIKGLLQAGGYQRKSNGTTD